MLDLLRYAGDDRYLWHSGRWTVSFVLPERGKDLELIMAAFRDNAPVQIGSGRARILAIQLEGNAPVTVTLRLRGDEP